MYSENKYLLTSDGELYHYGVKGMKWGIRRAEKKAARKAAIERKRAIKSEGIKSVKERMNEM